MVIIRRLWAIATAPLRLIWGTVIGWPRWYRTAHEPDKIQSIRLANLTWNTTPTGTFIGPDVVYKNVGKIPSTNITTVFYIATDKDGGNELLRATRMNIGEATRK